MEDKIPYGQIEDPNYNLMEAEKKAYKKLVKKTGTILGVSLVVFSLLQSLLVNLISLAAALMSMYPTRIGGLLVSLAYSDWFSIAGINILAYAAILPVMLQTLKLVPEQKIVKKKMRIRKIIMFFVLAMGLGYILNLIGSGINFIIAVMTNRNYANMSPVNSLMEEMHWATILYVSVIGPVLEEYVFRWVLLNRLRPFGEKAAILFTAVMFGLMHKNLSQILYATAIGIILGYVSVKTGRLIYNSLIHIMINSYSTILAGGLLSGMINGELYAVMILAVTFLMFAMMAASVVILCINWKKTKLARGNYPAGMEYRDFAPQLFINPGVALFTLLCLGMTFYYAFLS